MDVYYVGILSTAPSTILCDWVNWPKGFEAEMRKRLFKAGGNSWFGSRMAHLSAITALWNEESMVRFLSEVL